jgi:hypothetical protein
VSLVQEGSLETRRRKTIESAAGFVPHSARKVNTMPDSDSASWKKSQLGTCSARPD